MSLVSFLPLAGLLGCRAGPLAGLRSGGLRAEMGSRSPFEGGGHTRLQLQGGPRARGWFWGAGQGAGGWARKHGCHLANWPSPDLGSGEPERRWGPAAAAAEPLGQGGLSAQPSSLPAPPPLPAPGCPRLRRGGGLPRAVNGSASAPWPRVLSSCCSGVHLSWGSGGFTAVGSPSALALPPGALSA